MKKAFHYMAYIALIGWAGLIIYVTYLLVAPYDVFKVKNPTDLPIDKKSYVKGEKIAMTFDYEKTTDIKPEAQKELVCENSVTLLSEPRRLPVGKGVTKIIHTIPLNTPTDKNCRIYIFLSYKVNPLRTEQVNLRTDVFEVYNPNL